MIVWIFPLITMILSQHIYSLNEEDLLIPIKFRPYDFAVVPEFNLIFCRIHKAGSTALGYLLPSISSIPIPSNPSWTYYQTSDYNLNAEAVTRILQDSKWLKVLIYRDPLERFLSAYRSKCEEFHDGFTICDNVFHHRRPSFAQAVRSIVLQEDVNPDSHFLPQSSICNLRVTFPYFTERFILDTYTAYDNFLRVLKKANIQITPKINSTLFQNFPPPGIESIIGAHATHSSDYSTLLTYYNHDCWIRLIVHYYKEDYWVLKLPYPEWAIGALERTTVSECFEFIKSHYV